MGEAASGTRGLLPAGRGTERRGAVGRVDVKGHAGAAAPSGQRPVSRSACVALTLGSATVQQRCKRATKGGCATRLFRSEHVCAGIQTVRPLTNLIFGRKKQNLCGE